MPLHLVARFADLHEDRGTQVEIRGQKILLLKVGDQARAYQGLCPHAGAPLADGAVCDGWLVCPWHKAVFNVDDGQLCEPPALDGLARYPLELRGDEVWVGDQPHSDLTMGNDGDSRTFVVIGAGAAGIAATAALRDQGFGGRLVLIDREVEPGYDRTALSKFVIAGDMPAEKVPPLRDEAFYLGQRIERLHGEVRRLDVPGQSVTLVDGRVVEYDAALLATGGQPLPLPLPGAELGGVLLLRSRDDARRVLEWAEPGKKVVIIGDSFIGLEAASALRKHGLDVTVLARSEVPLRRQFGERVGRSIRQLHEDNGVHFRAGNEASAVEGEGRVERVVLKNGEVLPADLVLVGVGVRPATSMVHGLSLEDDGAVAVDGGMRAAPGLWAAGDIARFPLEGQPQRIEHWRLAQQQGRIAASNMLGANLAYADVPFFWTFQFGKRLDYLGHATEWDAILYEGEPESFEFVALYCAGNRVLAALGCQRERAMAWLAGRMCEPLSVEDALLAVRHMSD